MSFVGVRSPSLRGNRRRKGTGNLNLNVAAHVQNGDVEGSSSGVGPQAVQPSPQVPPAPIDVDAIDDDDVVLSSPVAFALAKNNSRRRRRATDAVDMDLEEGLSRPTAGNRHKRRRNPLNQTIIDCDQLINLEISSDFKKDNTKKPLEQSKILPPPPPAPPEPTFSCPICMGKVVEAVTTKCGHIFCKLCIKSAIASTACRNKCPTCRKKVTVKDFIRVYI